MNWRSQLRHCTTDPSRFSTKPAQDLISSSSLPLPPLPKFRLKLSAFGTSLGQTITTACSKYQWGDAKAEGTSPSLAEPCWSLLKKPSRTALWGEDVVAAGQVHSLGSLMHTFSKSRAIYSVWIMSCFMLSLVRTKSEQLLLCLTRDLLKQLFTAALLQHSVPVGSARTSWLIPME